MITKVVTSAELNGWAQTLLENISGIPSDNVEVNFFVNRSEFENIRPGTILLLGIRVKTRKNRAYSSWIPN